MRKLKLEELGRVGIEEFKQLEKIPVVIVLDNIRSAMNVGSFFRTCDAFKIEKIYLCGITARPPHKEILKTAIGATNSVEWEYYGNISDVVTLLKKEDYKVIGIEQTDQSIPISNYKVDLLSKYAITFGNEVQGLSEDILPMLTAAIEIPQYGTKHSLNVAVCGGIVLWAFSQPFLEAL